MNIDRFAAMRCPSCTSALVRESAAADDVDRLACDGCSRRWPVRFGIPDLRADGVADPYLSTAEDLRAAERLFDRASTGTFEDALASYYETNERVAPAQARRFISGALAAEERGRAVLRAWDVLAQTSLLPPGSTLVDAGCGTGPLLAAAGAPNVRLVGFDVGLRWLVLAAARLRDRGVEATLVCAGAERIPLADGSADVVAAESLYENVPSAPVALAESARLLRPGGWLCLTTPNRWSIGPDPHVGLPMGGWLPDSLVAAWARRRGMIPPKRHLLSAGDLRKALRELALTEVEIGPPPVADAQLAGASAAIRNAVGAYRVIARLGPGRALLNRIGPSLLAVARRR
jgi:SAM-dependent methyltransferase